VDLNLPSPARADSSSSEAESISSLPSRTDTSMPLAGVLGSLPDLSEKFKVNEPGPTIESPNRKGVSEGKWS
jgi:hypothetical protein